MKEFELAIYTPKRLFYKDKVKALNLKIAYGSVGILPDHIPLISSIQTSVFSIEAKKEKKREGIIIGGILFFENNVAKIFTSKVIWKENISKKDIDNKIDNIKKSLSKDISSYEREALEKDLNFYNLQK